MIRYSHALQSIPYCCAPGRDGSPRARRKVQAGEQLTAEERQLLQRSNKQQSDKRRADWLKDHTPQSSFGLTALTDLGTAMCKGEQGGLYPGGSNTAR